ncbi:MAG: VCBS repeat-containing protein, partial [Acidobacteria bacterium]|nr:VCBS repeat-containing protein [Acidobacteriota bacterium]
MAQATLPTFTAATDYPLGNVAPSVPGFMALGDLNGDGYADAVTSDGSEPSRLRILFNNAAGGFGGVTDLPISGFCLAGSPASEPTCAFNVYRVEIADFNAD